MSKICLWQKQLKSFAMFALLTMSVVAVLPMYASSDEPLSFTPLSLEPYVPPLSDYRTYLASGNNTYQVTVSALLTLFPNITVTAQITDLATGTPILGLAQNNFLVTEESSLDNTVTSVTTRDFEELTSRMISIVLVFDRSGSMDEEDRLEPAKAAAISLVDTLSCGDRIALVSFSGTARVDIQSKNICPELDGLGTSEIKKAINSLEAGGPTALNDAICVALNEIQSSSEPIPNAVIAFTDGETNSDMQCSINNVIERANYVGTKVYTIALGGDIESSALQQLQDIADNTGALYKLAPTADDMLEVYGNIRSYLAGRYQFSYTSPWLNYDGSKRWVTVTNKISGDDGRAFYTANSRPKIEIDLATLAMQNIAQPSNTPLAITGKIVDFDAQNLDQTVTGELKYRTIGDRRSAIGEAHYVSIPLIITLADENSFQFSAEIPANAVLSPGLEYYLLVSDGLVDSYGPVTFLFSPYSISVLPNLAPAIVHSPVKSWNLSMPNSASARFAKQSTILPRNQVESAELDRLSIPISAKITDEDFGSCCGVAYLYLRPTNALQETPFFPQKMLWQGADIYRAGILGKFMGESGVDYYISAWDSHGVRSDDGTAEAPYHIDLDSEAITHVITVRAEPDGARRVSCNPNPVPHGQSTTCTMIAYPPYQFLNWGGACNGAEQTCILTNVTTDQSVVGEFIIDQNEPPFPLNDTGIDWCAGTGSIIQLDCPVVEYPRQDGDGGRDVQLDCLAACNNGSESDFNTCCCDAYGRRGFSFTKLDDTGSFLPPEVLSWSCIRDNVTGLTWEVKTDDDGLHDKDWTFTWYDSDSPAGSFGTEDGGTCFGSGGCDTEKYVAEVNARGLCGFSDWRRPTAKELSGIVDYGIEDPVVVRNYNFLNAIPTDFWTATPDYENDPSAMVVSFTSGQVYGDYKSRANSLRLVRGPQASSSFFDNGDGTITDLNTGLMWAQCLFGTVGENCEIGTEAKLNWQQALEQAKQANLAGYTDWRVPNIKELHFLLDYSEGRFGWDQEFFPMQGVSSRYWSSSPLVPSRAYGYNDYAYGIDTYPDSHRVSFFGRSNDHYVRLVRDGELGGAGPETASLIVSMTGSGLISSDPVGINCGEDCSEAYPINTAVTLTATPDPDANFENWGGDCTGTGPECILTMDEAKMVEASFSSGEEPPPLETQTLTVQISSGNGRVTSNPAGIDCGNDCSEDYAAGTEVILTAMPNSDASFDSWGGACANTAESECVLTMDAAKTVTANFAGGVVPAPSVITNHLPAAVDMITLAGQAGSVTRYLDFGGNDVYTLPETFVGSVELIDNQAGILKFSPGMSIEGALFAADGLRLTNNGHTFTLLGNPAAFTFFIPGVSVTGRPDANLNFSQFAAMFGVTLPQAGDPPVAGNTGTIGLGGVLNP
jgi:Mg-chelatase subunit ChlD